MSVVLARVFGSARLPEDVDACGQATIATVLAHYGVPPLDPAACEGCSDGEAIDRVRAEFPPDVPFGLGTSAPRIVAALRHYGLAVDHAHSGLFGRGLGLAFGGLCAHVAAGMPGIVCLDQGRLGGTPFSAHWAIVIGIDAETVTLANAGTSTLTRAEFLEAWSCRHLPWGHNHCALLARARA